MMTPPSLTVRSVSGSAPAAVASAGTVDLPEAVESAAWLVPAGEELRVLINRPGAANTLQLRVSPDRGIERLEPLPCVAAGAASCDVGTVVTGADASGRAVVLGVSANGSVMWRIALDGPTPVRWPVPVCLRQPAIVWQTSAEQLHVAAVGPQGLGRPRSTAVGEPPLTLASGENAVWAAWLDPAGIRGVRIRIDGEKPFHQAMPRPGDVAIGEDGEGAHLVWTQGSRTFVAPVDEHGRLRDEAASLDLGDVSGGTLTVIPGASPLVWVQRAQAVEGEALSWASALAAPGYGPLIIDGLIHAVAWWRDTLVVFGTIELCFFNRTGADAERRNRQ